MPSRDPATGKRIPGCQQRKRAAQRNGATQAATQLSTTKRPVSADAPPLPVPLPFLDLAPPPVGAGVAAVEHWAAGANIRAAVAAEGATEEETSRVVAVTGIVRLLGKLLSKATRSANALELRRLRLGEPGLSADPPYDDPAAAPAWCFMKLAVLAHEAATSPDWRPDGRRVLAVQALAASGLVPCASAVEDVARRVERAG